MAGIFSFGLIQFILVPSLVFPTLGLVEGFARAARDRNSADEPIFLNALQTLDLCEQNMCGPPVRTFVPIACLTNSHIGRNYQPVGVIVYKCGGSGCCSSAYEKCVNSSATQVTFQVENLSPEGTFNVTVFNHTRCHCDQKLRRHRHKKQSKEKKKKECRIKPGKKCPE